MTVTELEPLPSRSRTAEKTIALLDRALGCLLAAATTPAVVSSAAVIVALSRRSPFIAHLRVGQHGRLLWVWKLRTMWDRQDGAKLRWMEKIVAEPAEERKNAHDPRVRSRFAAFCRRYSIDELPQLWQVARGEMSLVGPRPLTRSELARHYRGAAPEILAVKPGLTGFWQVHGRSRVSFAARVEMDRELVRRFSLRTYLGTLVRTIPAVLSGDGAW